MLVCVSVNFFLKPSWFVCCVQRLVCSRRHHSHDSYSPLQYSAPMHGLNGVHSCFVIIFSPPFPAESQGRSTFQVGGKGGHMVAKTTVSPGPWKEKAREKKILAGGREGGQLNVMKLSCTSPNIECASFTQLSVLYQCWRIYSLLLSVGHTGYAQQQQQQPHI